MLDIFIEPVLADDVKERKGNTIPGVTGPVEDAGESSVTSVPKSYEPQALSDVEVLDAGTYVGQHVGGKYRLAKKIGQGGMGEVYLGINDDLGQKVAVKFLSRKFADDEGIVQRFLNEARSYCRVNHPNAVTLLEYGQHDDGTLYIITEFVDGKNLAQHMKAHGFLPFPQIIALASQLCEVLASAHDQGVIHRDLKPDNLMLTPSSRGRYSLKVLDFGIAKIVDEEHEGPNTETGSVFGTPEFMSPEQARGEAADPRSDIYAVGIILFFMLTGKLPFKGKNKLVVLNKQLNQHPPRPTELRPDADIPKRLEAVVMKCLNKTPEGRYPSADDLLDALEELTVPVGEHTDKVGVAQLSESSEVSTTNTPEAIRHNTVRLGVADSSVEVDSFADTLASTEVPREIASELESVELWREQPTRETDVRKTDKKNHLSVAVAISVIVVVGVVLAATLMKDGAVDSEPDLENILVTGQVVGLLTAAEDMVEEGAIDAAMRSVGQTDMWLDDSALPEQLLDRRNTLKHRLETLQKIDERFQTAFDARECDEAEKIASEAKGLSDGYEQRLERRVRRCKGILERESNGAAEVPEKPTAPAEVKNEPVAPKEVPKVEEPTQPTEQIDPIVDTKTTEPAVDSVEVDETDTQPDAGLALPPKQL